MKKPELPRAILLLPLLAVVQLLVSCSSEQAYRAGQGWQQEQCKRIPDKTEYDRCMANAGMSYDTYKRESGAERK